MNLYNTLTKNKEKLFPLKDKKISLYVCGITPYATTHLGHTATYVFFDVLVRYLQYKKYKVNYVQNVTDIDDDILREAKKVGQDWQKVGEKWTNRYVADMEALNILPPTHFVKATDSIPAMIKIIKILMQKGFTYEKSGNVYFEVAKFKNYGTLSKLGRKQMIKISKERGADPADPNKKDPLDFILWQQSKAGEPFWQSPWGGGRPGWHIECSAMITQYLGEQIDIHGGGSDLIFPHHESEIAQSESFSGKKTFVKYWLHTSMVRYQGEKMSKSLGNLVMISELLKKYSPNAIRFLILSHHYRTPWEFREENLKKAQKTFDLIMTKIKITNYSRLDDKFLSQFDNNMGNDVDTPQVLSTIITLLSNNQIDEKLGNSIRKALLILGFTLGV